MVRRLSFFIFSFFLSLWLFCPHTLPGWFRMYYVPWKYVLLISEDRFELIIGIGSLAMTQRIFWTKELQNLRQGQDLGYFSSQTWRSLTFQRRNMVGWKEETCAHDYKKYSCRARTVHVNLKSRLPLPLPPLSPSSSQEETDRLSAKTRKCEVFAAMSPRANISSFLLVLGFSWMPLRDK